MNICDPGLDQAVEENPSHVTGDHVTDGRLPQQQSETSELLDLCPHPVSLSLITHRGTTPPSLPLSLPLGAVPLPGSKIFFFFLKD